MLNDIDDKEALINDSKRLGNFHREINALVKVKIFSLFSNFKNEYVRNHANENKEELIHKLSIIDELIDYVNKNY